MVLSISNFSAASRSGRRRIYFLYNVDHTTYALVIDDRFVGGMMIGYVRAFMKELYFDFI